MIWAISLTVVIFSIVVVGVRVNGTLATSSESDTPHRVATIVPSHLIRQAPGDEPMTAPTRRRRSIGRRTSFAAFDRLPRRLGWKYEYSDGEAHVSPANVFVPF